MRQFIRASRSTLNPVAMVAAVLVGACLTSSAAAQNSRAIRITDITVTFEGNGGSENARFTVRRDSGGTSGSVQYATANVTATGGNSSCNGTVDYLSRTDALGFSATDTVKTIDITVCGDNLDEATETFTINLSSTSLQIGDATGQATIVDDDPTPTLRIGNVTVVEGNGGQTATATFTVTLSAVSGQQVSVALATNNGSALAGACGNGGDYVALTNTVTVLPGAAPSQQVSITVCGDVVAEGNETFQVRLSGPQNATIQTGTGTATITDDEPTLTITMWRSQRGRTQCSP